MPRLEAPEGRAVPAILIGEEIPSLAGTGPDGVAWGGIIGVAGDDVAAWGGKLGVGTGEDVTPLGGKLGVGSDSVRPGVDSLGIRPFGLATAERVHRARLTFAKAPAAT